VISAASTQLDINAALGW